MPLAAIFWQYPSAGPWVAGAWLLVSGLVILTYRRQTRSLPVGWRWVLPAVRLLAITAIALSVLRPVITRPKTAGEQGPVLIVLDATVTMGVVDNTRSTGQWVAIAAATGRLPGVARETELETAKADCDKLIALADEVNRARAAVDYARLAGRGVDSAGIRLTQAVNELHTTAKQTSARLPASLKTPQLIRNLATLINEPARTDRDNWLDHARERAGQIGAEVDQRRLTAQERLYSSDTAVRDAATALSNQTRLQLAAIAAGDLAARLPPGTPVRVVSVGDAVRSLDPTAPGPVATTAVQAVCSKLAVDLAAQPVPPRAVVIFSDGRHLGTDLRPATPGGSRDAPPAVPVFAVDVAAQSPPRDLAILSMTAPPTAFVDEPVTVRATIRAQSFGLKTVDAVFDVGDQPTTRPVRLTDDRAVGVDAELRFPSPGPTRITLDLPPVDGEASTVNNHAERWVKVIDRPTRVGIFASHPSPDQTAAVAAWSNRPGIELVSATGPGSLPFTEIPTEKLADLDLIVCFDLDPAAMTAEQWAAIRTAVADRGGSIVWMPGDADRSAAIAANPILDGLLGPTGHDRPDWIRRPGNRATYRPVAPGSDDRESTVLFTRYLPPAANNGQRTLLLESESGTPILTSRGIGRGRVFALTASGFTGDTGKFWNDLLKSAVDEPYEAEDESAAIDADAVAVGVAVEPGKPVHVRVRLFGPGTPVLRVSGSDPVVRDITAGPDRSPNDGRFAFTVSDLSDGDHTLQAIVDGKPIGPVIPLHVHADPAAGLAELAGDEYPLRRLADTTGGKFLRLDQIDTLPKRLADLPADTTHPVEQPLWDTPLLFGLVTGLFVLEWTLRKIAGLA